MLGRTVELNIITTALEEVDDQGGTTLVVTGEAGIGKSTLLAAAASWAAAQGYGRLECSGVQGHFDLGYAALHELIHKQLPHAHALPTRQRTALMTAFGLEDGPTPDRLLISLAVLGLLEESAAAGTRLLVVDDVQWIDRSSLDVLAFVARRLSNAPLMMLFAERTTGLRSAPTLEGLPLLSLGPLDFDHSAQLLAAAMTKPERPEAIDPDLQKRVLDQANGNPLAVLELTATLDERGASMSASEPLPTSRRVERAFLTQLESLPEPSRLLLLLIAAGDGSLSEIHTAASSAGCNFDVHLGPLEDSGLVTINGSNIRVRHPLIRSAVYGAASLSTRSAIHKALAAGTTDSNRATWHRAEATFGPDERIASEMEQVARTAQARGAGPEATAALQRAARLSANTADKVRRLAMAAEVARSAGLTDTAVGILREAQPLSEGDDNAVSLAITRFVLNLTAAIPGHSESDLLSLAIKCEDDSDDQRRLLWAAAIACRMHGLPDTERADIRSALLRLTDRLDDPMVDIAMTLVDDTGAHRLQARLPKLMASLEDDPLHSMSLAFAAEAISDRKAALQCWTQVRDHSRLTGRPANECEALRGSANIFITQGHLRAAVTTAEHAVRMAEDMHLPATAASAAAILARALAWQGQLDRARSALEQARLLLAEGDPWLLWNDDARWAAGMIALCDNQPTKSLSHLMKMTLHRTSRRWAIADLAEAAAASDQPELVRPILSDIETQSQDLGINSLLVHRAHALISPSARVAEDHFRAALHAGENLDADLEVARTQLLFGEWLRRRRQITDARTHLSAALAAFDGAGAVSFARRAGSELRAAGVPIATPSAKPSAANLLTSQEWLIAQMAAEGLTNREIADRIYLSHRTVATHLYKIFPKLGITSRNQLNAAISGSVEHLGSDL